MKRKLLTLSLIGLTAVLTGCGAKTITKEEAIKFANENYGEELKEFHVVDIAKISKVTGYFEEIFEVGETKQEDDTYATPLNEEMINYICDTTLTSATWKLDGKKLFLEGKIDASSTLPIEGITGEATLKANTDDLGYVVFEETWMSLSLNTTFMGVEISGSVEILETLTYTAK